MFTAEKEYVHIDLKLKLSNSILDHERNEIVGELLVCLREHNSIPSDLKTDLAGSSYISEDITLHFNNHDFTVSGLFKDVNTTKLISWFIVMYEKYKKDLSFQLWITGRNGFIFSCFLYTEEVKRNGIIERDLRIRNLGPDVLMSQWEKVKPFNKAS